MGNPSVMQRALRQAKLYGHLVARGDQLYHPGGSHPLLNISTAGEMVRSGWLAVRNDRYEITAERRQVSENQAALKELPDCAIVARP